MKKVMTVGLIRKGGKILLDMKKKGFGSGRWNGFGGKVEKSETIAEGQIREFREECGIKVSELKQIGHIEYNFQNDSLICDVHFFDVLEYLGTPVETEEMRPKWFDISEIPYESMWPDDKIWMPLYLSDKKFEGKILFKDSDTIIENNVCEI